MKLTTMVRLVSHLSVSVVLVFNKVRDVNLFVPLFQNLTVEDAGLYECTAWNKFGKLIGQGSLSTRSEYSFKRYFRFKNKLNFTVSKLNSTLSIQN